MTVVAYFIKILVYASTNVCNKAIFVKFMRLYHTTPLPLSTRPDTDSKTVSNKLKAHESMCLRIQQKTDICINNETLSTLLNRVFSILLLIYIDLYYTDYSTGKTTLGHNTLFVCLLIAPVAVKI